MSEAQKQTASTAQRRTPFGARATTRHARVMSTVGYSSEPAELAIDHALITGQPITPQFVGADHPLDHDQPIPSGKEQAAKQTTTRDEKLIPPLANADDMRPAGRQKYLEQWAPEMLKEWREEFVMRMVMRGIPYDRIATALQVSVKTVKRTIAAISEKHRSQAKQIDAYQQVGEMLATNKMIIAELFKVADAQGTPAATKIVALRSIAQINSDQLYALDLFGLIDREAIRIPTRAEREEAFANALLGDVDEAHDASDEIDDLEDMH